MIKQEIIYDSLLRKIELLFNNMDLEYKLVSKQYQFNCIGCQDSCCFTTFYHYTFLEWLYLMKGFNKTIQQKQKQKIVTRAKQFKKKLITKCPLYINDKCTVYNFRPMICRLHGVPYELKYPNNKTLTSCGCHNLKTLATQKHNKKLNRTPFYEKLAHLELKFKKKHNIKTKIKMTVSEMIINRQKIL